ncbi:MAG: restriction endonuclease subunit S [Monoglobales bacterium]
MIRSYRTSYKRSSWLYSLKNKCRWFNNRISQILYSKQIYAVEYSKKGTGTPHLNAQILKQSKLSVPPIAEQERIVTRIEELFSELDKAVETLKTTKQQLEPTPKS